MNSKLLCCAVFLASATALVAGPKLKPIFNGKDLSGWEVPDGNDEAGWYKAVEGVLKIQSGSKKKGSILWSKKKYRNFVVEFEFRMGEGRVDSGMHVRTKDQIQIGISGSLNRDMTCSPYIPGKGYPVEAKNIKKTAQAKRLEHHAHSGHRQGIYRVVAGRESDDLQIRLSHRRRPHRYPVARRPQHVHRLP